MISPPYLKIRTRNPFPFKSGARKETPELAETADTTVQMTKLAIIQHIGY